MSADETLQNELSGLSTEQRNPATMAIDEASTAQILRMIHEEDRRIPLAIERELPSIEQAVELIVDTLTKGGRLLYVGAGTSGRLGVLDAVECPPTFGTDPAMIRGIIAGGEAAMFRAQEGAEDDTARAAGDIDALEVSARDLVCGIAASRRTPYVVGAVARAKALGARTIYVTTNPRSDFHLDVDVAICPDVGPEVIMGSTRMKSGTAQKLVLNMLTTAAMIRMGKVYENMMVDLQLTNRKLVERARRILMLATGAGYEEARSALDRAGGHVKTALVMMKTGAGAEEARQRLDRSGGFIRRALAKQ